MVASDAPKLNLSPDNKDNAMVVAVGPLRNYTMRHKATTLGNRYFKENYKQLFASPQIFLFTDFTIFPFAIRPVRYPNKKIIKMFLHILVMGGWFPLIQE